MAAGINDKFSKTFNSVNPSVARVTSSRTAGGTTLACDNLAGWPTDTVVQFSTYQLDASDAVVANSQIDWKGIVSGNNIGTLTRVAGATDAGSSVGDVVEMNPTASWANDLVDGLLEEHNQDGTHGDVTADSLVVSGTSSFTGAVTLPANTVSNSNVTTGIPVQVVSTNFAALATGTNTIPLDDTIPQITEGTEFMTQAITPKATTNVLSIEATMTIASSTAEYVIAALFKDTTANALAATTQYQSTGGGDMNIKITHNMTAGTTSLITFRIRAGLPSAGSVYFNGRAGSRLFGGITLSNMKITEYKA